MTERVFPKRRQSEPPPRPIADHATVDGQVIGRDTELTVTGESGIFKFRYRWLPDGSLTCYGGPAGHEQLRSFLPERCHLIKARRRWTTPRTDDQLEVMRERIAAARTKLAEKRAQS